MCDCLSHAPYWGPGLQQTGNRTGDPLVCRQALNPLSYTSQGYWFFFLKTPSDGTIGEIVTGTSYLQIDLAVSINVSFDIALLLGTHPKEVANEHKEVYAEIIIPSLFTTAKHSFSP